MTALGFRARLEVAVGSGARSFELSAELALDAGILVLFGPSGSGKSLTLQALAGLVKPSEGEISVGETRLLDTANGIDVPTHERRIGYVPQDQALFPFLDVAGNVGFGLTRPERHSRSGRVAELLETFSLSSLAAARPEALSGGERQRVALARAVAISPHLLLLDEPFASIDPAGRAEVRASLRASLDRLEIPTVLVTHDIGDALELGDLLVPMDCGRTAAPRTPAAHFGSARLRALVGPRETLPDGRVRVHLEEAELTATDLDTPEGERIDRPLS